MAAFLCSQFLFLKAQENNKIPGEIHGNFEMTTQFYSVDTVIGAPIVPEKVLMNGFLNLIYTKDKFTAGLRYEAYQNVLQGFDPGYAGSGIYPKCVVIQRATDLPATIMGEMKGMLLR